MTVGTDKTALKKLLRSDGCEFVSLGYNCDVAQLLRYSGLRKKAYPFDWCITPINSVISLIESDFYHFLNFSSLVFSKPHNALFFEENNEHITESEKKVVTASCSEYKMVFPHDFSDASSEVYDDVINKYKKRIERFLELMSGDKVVVFVINYKVDGAHSAQIDRLKDILSFKYPRLRFQIYSYDVFKSGVNKSLIRFVWVFFSRKKQRVNKFMHSLKLLVKGG